MEVWRWTTNAARPSKWAPLRDGPFLAERVCKIDMMHVVTPVRFKTCFLFFFSSVQRLTMNHTNRSRELKGVYGFMDLVMK